VLKDEYLVIAVIMITWVSGAGIGFAHARYRGGSQRGRRQCFGAALVMELAKRLAPAKKKIEKKHHFVSFSAEEIGLIGSKYFVDHPPVELKKIKPCSISTWLAVLTRRKIRYPSAERVTSAEGDSILKSLEAKLPFTVVHSPTLWPVGPRFILFVQHPGVSTPPACIWIPHPVRRYRKLDFGAEKLIGDYAFNAVVAVDDLPKALTFKESGKKQSAAARGASSR